MKNILFPIFISLLLSCNQQNNEKEASEHLTEQSHVMDSIKAYEVIKYENTGNEITDSSFMVGDELYEVRIKNYSKGDYHIADTIENKIYLYQENFIDISVNNKTTTISKNNFSGLYPNKNEFYHSTLGSGKLDSIDFKNKKIIFSTFFGYNQSDFGEYLKYSISFDGQYEFIKVETPLEENLNE